LTKLGQCLRSKEDKANHTDRQCDEFEHLCG
jgi:hypothetical protein